MPTQDPYTQLTLHPSEPAATMTTTRPKNIPIAAAPGLLFAMILGLEAMLSLVSLASLPVVSTLTSMLSVGIPVIANFAATPLADRNVPAYLTLTLLLAPIKVYAAYLLVAKLDPEDRATVVCFPSSSASFARRVVSTALLAMLCVGFGWYLLTYGGPYFSSPAVLRSASAKYLLVRDGGPGMWLSWSVLHLGAVSLLFGLFAVFVAEWARRLFNFK